ncbi:MAG: hypothetical protein ACREIA_20155 [Opitutaceae bacterium]
MERRFFSWLIEPSNLYSAAAKDLTACPAAITRDQSQKDMKSSTQLSVSAWCVVGLLTVGVIWSILYSLWLSGSYREEILDAFLQSPDLDSGVGATIRFLESMGILTVAVVAALFLWCSGRSKREGVVFILGFAIWLCVAAWHVSRPSLDAVMERRILDYQERALGGK